MLRGRRLPGFTIMEMAIALSIAVLMVAVGIPRYNSFVQRQDFIDNVYKVASCLQKGNRAALAPGVINVRPIRFSEVFLSQQGLPTDNRYTCYVFTWDSARYQLDNAMYSDTSIEKVLITDFSAEGTSYALNFPFRTLFGTLENGAPVELYNGNPLGGVDQTIIDGSTIPYGRGFTLDIGVRSAEVSGLNAIIRMQRMGNPIEVIINNP